MRETNKFNAAIMALLDATIIEYHVLPGDEDGIDIICVDRISMCCYWPVLGEQNSYDATLKLIKEACPDAYVCWNGRTDDWMSVGVYQL